MDPVGHGFAVYSPIGHLTPSSHANHLHASESDSAWQRARVSVQPVSISPLHSPSLFPPPERSPDQEYPSPAPSNSSPFPQLQHSEQYITSSQPISQTNSSTELLLPPFTQTESSVGPTRVMTRRRAHQSEKHRERRGSLHQDLQLSDHSYSSQNSSLYSPRRPSFPSFSNEESTQYQRGHLSLSACGTLPPQHSSPTHNPMTPASVHSPSYYAQHGTRSSSGVSPDRRPAASPAVSCASSASSRAYSPYPPPSKPKPKKQRLDNITRKNICLYHQQHPSARQEDIAVIFKVERSTISKILKYKDRWLNMAGNEVGSGNKHKSPKYPEIEEALIKWVEAQGKTATISDRLLHDKSVSIAKSQGNVVFKGSGGWIEKFKERYSIRGGMWLGRPTKPQTPTSNNHTGDGSPLNHTPDTSVPNAVRQINEGQMTSEELPVRRQVGHGVAPAGEQVLPASPAISGNSRSSWMEPTNHISPGQPLTQSPLSARHEVEPTSTLSQDPLEAPFSAHQHTAEASTTYYYEPRPAPMPTLEEARAAIQTLITYIHTTPNLTEQKIILPEDREALTHISAALFQAANNVPYIRPT